MDWNQIWQTVQSWLMNTGIKIVISIILLIVSFAIINFIAKKVEKHGKKAEEKHKVDKTLYRTLSYILKVGLKVIVAVCLIGYLGINTGAITALIASLGVGVGLAVNGTLSNFAGGVLLIITRPFRDDDYIAANGYEGTVEDIRICYTIIRTYDNKLVYLPNGKLSTGEIVNYTAKGTRRVDINFTISYNADFKKAEGIFLDVCAKNPLILQDPAPSSRVAEHGDSSIVLGSKAWCKTEDYWTVYFDLMEQVKTAFDENGIEIPYNQLDVHVKND